MAKYDDIPVKESKSPLKRNRARSWKHILIDNFRNSRTTYFDHLAANFDNMDDVLNHRHEIKKAMYRQNHVSLQYRIKPNIKRQLKYV